MPLEEFLKYICIKDKDTGMFKPLKLNKMQFEFLKILDKKQEKK